MARAQRVNVTGGVYHVMLRGNDGQDIFYGNEDRCHLYLLLLEGVERFDYRIHAFCFMNNHLHLVIQIGGSTLSRIMQNISFRYTQWINFRLDRSGHLFQGRYQAIMVESDGYLLELVRYVHLNPVRAGLVENPQQWRWSGHRAYLGHEHIPWLCTDSVLGQFSDSRALAQTQYARFVESVIGEDRWERVDQGMVQKESYPADILPQTVFDEEPAVNDMETIELSVLVRAVCNEYDMDMSELLARNRRHLPSEVRAVVAWLAVDLKAATLTGVAQLFGRDVATLSGSVRKIEARRKSDAELHGRIEQIRDQLMQHQVAEN